MSPAYRCELSSHAASIDPGFADGKGFDRFRGKPPDLPSASRPVTIYRNYSVYVGKCGPVPNRPTPNRKDEQ